MTRHHMHQTTSLGSDDPRVAEVIEAARRLHRADHPDCDCEEIVKLKTVTNTSAVENVDGEPLGVDLVDTPLVTVTFRIKEKE